MVPPQPLLVIENEGRLFPHRIRDLEQIDYDNFKNFNSIFSWTNSFLSPLENGPFEVSLFDKIYQETSPHLRVTADCFNLFRGSSSLEEIKSMHGFLKVLFYYSPQSDAIGYRQKNYTSEFQEILYYPTLTEVSPESKTDEKSRRVLLLDSKKFELKVNFYVPKSVARKNK